MLLQSKMNLSEFVLGILQ